MNARITPLPAYTPDNWDAEVGARIKALLIGRGTQDDIARAIGLQQADVSKRINGRVQWKGHELGLVANLLGVSVSKLYGETDGDMPPAVGPEGLEPPTDSVKSRELAEVLPFRQRSA